MALGTTTTAVLLALGGAGAGFGASKMMSGGGGGGFSASPTPMPQAPSTEGAAEAAGDVVKKKRAAMSKTTYTSPLGVAGEAQVARKTLLGQ